MGKKSKQRNEVFQAYFNKMYETAKIVDPIIVGSIDNIAKDYNGLSDILYDTLKGRVSHDFVKPKIRPFTVRMGYEICGGKKWEDIASACAAAEMLDAGYYAADDIFDIPFDKPITELSLINEKTIASHIFRTLAYNLLRQSKAPVINLYHAEKFMICSDKEIYQGFWTDLHMTQDTDESLYWKKVEKYSYWDWILSIGASLANASNEQLEALQKFGKKIGMAWTLANDTVDFTKKNEDIRLGRRTLPILYLLKNMKGEDEEIIKRIYRNINASKQDLEKLKQIVVRSGVITSMKQKCVNLADEGIKYLEFFPPSLDKEILKYSKRILTNNKFYKRLEDSVNNP